MTGNHVVELRIYKLKPGAAGAFADRFREQIAPMLGRHGIELVHFGPSLADPDSFCLIRAFPSVEQRQAALDAFYGSREWLEQHDQPVMAMIDSYNTCVVGSDALTPLS